MLPARETDWAFSVRLLTQSFQTWSKVQRQYIATEHQYQCYLRAPLTTDHDWEFLLPCEEEPGGKPLLELIARTKYSKVYQARNLKRAEPVVYKILTCKARQLTRHQAKLLRLIVRELSLLHSFRHPHLMQAIASQCLLQHGHFYQVIHKLPMARDTLETAWSRHQITTFPEAIQVLSQVALALSYLHQRGYYHGDVKPANVFLFEGGLVQLGDFNLSVDYWHSMEMSHSSLPYRPPELCFQGGDYTLASDMWSFGLLMLDVLYGLPFLESFFQVENTAQLVDALTWVLNEPNLQTTQNVPQWQRRLQKLLTKAGTPLKPLLKGESQLETRYWDLMWHLLRWDPDQRYSVQDTLDHPLWGIRHREGEEVKHDRDSDMTISMSWMERSLAQLCPQTVPDFFGRKVVRLYHRLVQALTTRQVTFTEETIFEECFYFLWFLLFKPDLERFQRPDFQSVMCHILMLLNYQVELVEEPEIESLLHAQYDDGRTGDTAACE